MSLRTAHLRIESDGAGAREYRIVDGRVEVRSIPIRHGDNVPRGAWHRLTPEQLGIHVERNTAVARWLEHRIGWRQLLRACTGQDFTGRDMSNSPPEHHAA